MRAGALAGLGPRAYGRAMSLPDWAHFIADPARYASFLRAIEQGCARLEIGLELDAEAGILRPREQPEAGGAQLSVGLKSLAQRWHGFGERAEGPAGEALIQSELEQIAARLQPDPELEAELDQLERARPRLRLRLFNERAAVAMAVGLVQRRLTRGLFAALALDLPTSLRPVAPERLARWGSSLDELWPQALAQTLATPVQVEAMRLFDRIPCVAVTGDSLVTTSQLLGLEGPLAQVLGRVPDEGAVVVVPNRHTLLAYPLGVYDFEAQTALLGLAKAGAHLYEQGPGSLSPELNWWRPGGSLEHIRAGLHASGRLVLGASQDFLDCIGAPGERLH